MPTKQGVETADAGETTGVGHVDQSQVRFHQQLLGQEQPIGLRQFHWRDAELLANGPTELSGTDMQFRGKLFDPAVVVERPGPDAGGRLPGQVRHGVDRRMSRRQLGTAAQTGPKSVAFGQCRIRKEPASVAPRRAGRADWTAVDSRGRHAHEEQPVETHITCGQGPVTGLIVECHTRSLPASRSAVWPFSDTDMQKKAVARQAWTCFHAGLSAGDFPRWPGGLFQRRCTQKYCSGARRTTRSRAAV